MHIILIGAGEVGRYLAQILIEEQHDVCIIEQDAKLARELDESVDAQVIHGTGVSREALFRAGITKADLLLAITQVDEVNLIAAMTAERLAPDCRTVARVREPRYMYGTDAIAPEEYGVDLLVGPEQAVAERVVDLLRYVGPGQIAPVADGRVALLEIPVIANTAPVWATLEELDAELPGQALIAAVLGNDGLRIPGPKDRFQVGERLFAVCARDAIADFLNLVVSDAHQVEHVLLVGGGSIGLSVGRELQRLKLGVTIIERDAEAAEAIAVKLNKAIVIQGDGTEPTLLAEQMHEQPDAVVVLLDDDEKSMLTGIVAKHLGARKVIARVDKREYGPIAHKLGVDAVLSPRRTVADAILRFVRRGTIDSTTMLGDHQGELIDFRIGKKPQRKELLDRAISELPLPEGSMVALIARNKEILVNKGRDETIQPGDHVFVVALRSAVPDLEALFA